MTGFSERFRPAKAATLAVLALGFAAALKAGLPGFITFDTVTQLLDGRTGTYHLWHPPVMAWLLGLGDRILPGAALFVVGDALLLFASLGLMVWRGPRVSWIAVVVAAAMVASPLVLIYQGEVWKDVLFANASVAGFLLLSLGAGRIGVTSGVGFACLVLAALTRQNGVLVLPLGALAFALAAGPSLGWRKALIAALVALVVGVGVVGAASAWFTARRADPEGPAAQFRLLQLYDIIGTLQRDPTIDLTPLGPEAAKVRQGLVVYTPQRVDTLSNLAGLEEVAEARNAGPLAIVWKGVVVHHTSAWIGHKLAVFGWTAFTPQITRCVPVVLGVDGDHDQMKDLGLVRRFDGRDRALAAYAARFYGTPVFSHLAYAVLALVLAGVLLIRPKSPRDLPVGMMLVATLAFAASFLPISVACDYRYLYALDLSAMAAALYVACGRGAPR